MRSKELLLQRPNQELLSGATYLNKDKSAMDLARLVCKQIGITRVAEIGGFIDQSISVCQTTRPRLFHHYRTGVNTGSQGKGYSREQAYISSVMEAAETYCGEPRHSHFIHGSYNELKGHYRIVPPSLFIPSFFKNKVSKDHALMWTTAIDWQSKLEVLVPAEFVYTFHIPEIYGDKPRFPASSAGMAAGFDSQFVVMRALMEIVEQHYRGLAESLHVKVEWLIPSGTLKNIIDRTTKGFNLRNQTHFFAIRAKGAKHNIPFIICFMGDSDKFYLGWGLNLNPIKAIESAHLEAFQAWSTEISGTRENMIRKSKEEPANVSREEQEFFDNHWPDEPNLDFETFLNYYPQRREFEESPFESIAGILRSLGYRNIFLCNLSRRGVSCFVAKALVPKLELSHRIHKSPDEVKPATWEDIVSWQYLFSKRRERRKK